MGLKMKANENIIKGKWLEFKGEVKKAWGNLTDDDLEKTKGDIKAIGGLIQQKYGKAQKDYDKKLNTIQRNIDSKKDQSLSQIKKSLRK